MDYGLPVKVGGVWIEPGDLLHGDQHGVLTIPHEIADRIPEAAARVDAEERSIIEVCQSPDFSVERLKAVYRQLRPRAY